MTVSSSLVRNVLGGIVIAVSMSFVSVELSAYDQCSASTPCAEGTALHGFDIECGCQLGGSCSVVTVGHVVECACDEFPVVQCDCENGCP
jgi:hypothetical protein